MGGIYEEVTKGGVTQKIHYVGDFALFIQTGGATPTNSYEYLHRDHIGSIVAISKGTVASANDINWQSNGAWGERRYQQWNGPLDGSLIPSSTAKGFTDHEHLDAVGLIHMNGRVYDPELGRFMSADPFVQAPYNSQSYNRYSYVWNNPLSFTDPSGYEVVCNRSDWIGGTVQGNGSVDWQTSWSNTSCSNTDYNGLDGDPAETAYWDDVARHYQTSYLPQDMPSNGANSTGWAVPIPGNVFLEAAGALTLDDAAAIGGGTDQLLALTGLYLTQTIKQGQLSIIRVNDWKGFNYQKGLRSGLSMVGGLSKGLFFVGTTISVIQGAQAAKANDGFGVTKSVVDVGVGVGALLGGTVGFTGGFTYYGTSTLFQYSPSTRDFIIGHTLDSYEYTQNVWVPNTVDFACKLSGC